MMFMPLGLRSTLRSLTSLSLQVVAGASGALLFSSGTTANGATGSLIIASGVAAGGASGALVLSSGPGSAGSGSMYISTGGYVSLLSVVSDLCVCCPSCRLLVLWLHWCFVCVCCPCCRELLCGCTGCVHGGEGGGGWGVWYHPASPHRHRVSTPTHRNPLLISFLNLPRRTPTRWANTTAPSCTCSTPRMWCPSLFLPPPPPSMPWLVLMWRLDLTRGPLVP